METIKKSQIKKRKSLREVTFIYFGDDPVFAKKMSVYLDKKNTFKIYGSQKRLLTFLKQNRNAKNVIVSDFNLENGKSGLSLNKIISVDYPETLFLLLSDKNVNKSQILLAKDKGIKDVLLKSGPIQKIMARIYFHIDSKGEKKEKAYKIIKSEISPGKRIFDLIFTTIALVILSPILVLVAILIKIDSPGPIFYVSKRVGTDCRIFDFYKFRSMRKDAGKQIDNMKGMNQYGKDNINLSLNNCEKCQEEGFPCSPILVVDGDEICETLYLTQKGQKKSSFLKFKNDPRITRLGRFIRKTSIDELPQLLNVLKGDMSIVGNRPLPIYEAEQLTDDQWSLRFLAPAGLTGLWQISKRGKAKMSEDERKELDNTYAKNHSFFGDIVIIFRTIPALFQSENV